MCVSHIMLVPVITSRMMLQTGKQVDIRPNTTTVLHAWTPE